MTKEQLIEQSTRIITVSQSSPQSALTQAVEFLRVYAGEKTSFYKILSQINVRATNEYKLNYVFTVLNSFIQYVENDLLRSISLEREIQIETVSDYLCQAETLLHDKNVHPAAAAVIIGA